MADNTNPYDAPVPGFIGPDGEGVANFNEDYNEREDPGPIDEYGSRNYVNPVFLSWASTVEAYQPAPEVDLSWRFSGEALGPVTGDNFAVVSLGDLTSAQIAAGVQPGYLTVSFAEPVYDAPGADLVLFENGFIANSTLPTGTIKGQIFGELAYVEVSSDNIHFARFPSVSRTPARVGKYGTIDASNVYNLVGKHANAYGRSWGTPFDLSDLLDHPMVQSGQLDLNNVRYVRIVDIPGSGDYLDASTPPNPIYDAWHTFGSGGADIEAIGAVSQAYTYQKWQAKQNEPRPTDDLSTFTLIGGPMQDEDADGVPNAMEYLLALDPRAKDSTSQLQIAYDPVEDQFRLGFSRDVRVADYVLVLERTEDLTPPAVWEPVLRLGPQNAEEHASARVVSVDSISLLPQASLGVIRRYDVIVQGPVQSGLRREFFRLRAEPVSLGQ